MDISLSNYFFFALSTWAHVKATTFSNSLLKYLDIGDITNDGHRSTYPPIQLQTSCETLLKKSVHPLKDKVLLMSISFCFFVFVSVINNFYWLFPPWSVNLKMLLTCTSVWRFWTQSRDRPSSPRACLRTQTKNIWDVWIEKKTEAFGSQIIRHLLNKVKFVCPAVYLAHDNIMC